MKSPLDQVQRKPKIMATSTRPPPAIAICATSEAEEGFLWPNCRHGIAGQCLGFSGGMIDDERPYLVARSWFTRGLGRQCRRGRPGAYVLLAFVALPLA